MPRVRGPGARGWLQALELKTDTEAAAGLEEADATALQREAARRLDDSKEARAIAGSFRHVCVRRSELPGALPDAVKAVSKGLPAWNARDVPSRVGDVAIAFLIQVAWKQQLHVLRRVFDRLYSPKDLFLYIADAHYLEWEAVAAALPKPLPKNVLVQQQARTAYFMWPRVDAVLKGLATLLQHEQKWDFAIHLSEADYPVHSLSWIRQALAAQRTTNFIQGHSRCRSTASRERPVERDRWYWWGQSDVVASCAGEVEAHAVKGVHFPLEEVEQNGLKLAHGSEWVMLTREVVKYALSSELLPFRKLIGMHLGSDEIFWQTLVINIPGFRQNVSEGGWFIKWGHGKTLHSPDVLTERYKDALMQKRGHVFFMRKVTEDASRQLLDELDSLRDQPILAQLAPGKSWLESAVLCPQGTGSGNLTVTCRLRAPCHCPPCGCPPYKDPHCDVQSVVKDPYCLKSEKHCGSCAGAWC